MVICSLRVISKKILRNISIHVTGRGVLLGFQILTIPICLGSRLTDGGECVSPTHGPPSAPQVTIFCVWYSFLLRG
jgi:hypothetical protein